MITLLIELSATLFILSKMKGKILTNALISIFLISFFSLIFFYNNFIFTNGFLFGPGGDAAYFYDLTFYSFSEIPFRYLGYILFSKLTLLLSPEPVFLHLHSIPIVFFITYLIFFYTKNSIVFILFPVFLLFLIALSVLNLRDVLTLFISLLFPLFIYIDRAFTSILYVLSLLFILLFFRYQLSFLYLSVFISYFLYYRFPSIFTLKFFIFIPLAVIFFTDLLDIFNFPFNIGYYTSRKVPDFYAEIPLPDFFISFLRQLFTPNPFNISYFTNNDSDNFYLYELSRRFSVFTSIISSLYILLNLKYARIVLQKNRVVLVLFFMTLYTSYAYSFFNFGGGGSRTKLLFYVFIFILIFNIAFIKSSFRRNI